MAIPKKKRRSGRSAARGAEALPTRSDILERAAHLIGKKGFVGMSAQDIADELQFSKANFFYHVRSKEELLHEIFVENLNYGIRHVEAIIARPDAPPDRLRALMEFYVRLNTERAAIMLRMVQGKKPSHRCTSEGDRSARRSYRNDAQPVLPQRRQERPFSADRFKNSPGRNLRHGVRSDTLASVAR